MEWLSLLKAPGSIPAIVPVEDFMPDPPGIAMAGICADGAMAGGIAISGFADDDEVGIGIAIPLDGA